MSLRRPLASLLCLLGLATSAQAQTTPAAYKYAATVSVAVPKNSAADAASKDKTLPTSIKFSPCNAGRDQLLFTVKYDAGKDSASLQNTYLIFHRDNSFFPLVRQGLNNVIAPIFKSYTSPADIPGSDSYTAAENNLGGLKTDIVLGGELPLEGMASGIWMVTAIIAPAASVNFDDPATWSAWDTTTFMLGKPWIGWHHSTCT
ncbi:hypothetical protein MASR1M59_13240 [Melaminivora sp.]